MLNKSRKDRGAIQMFEWAAPAGCWSGHMIYVRLVARVYACRGAMVSSVWSCQSPPVWPLAGGELMVERHRPPSPLTATPPHTSPPGWLLVKGSIKQGLMSALTTQCVIKFLNQHEIRIKSQPNCPNVCKYSRLVGRSNYYVTCFAGNINIFEKIPENSEIVGPRDR